MTALPTPRLRTVQKVQWLHRLFVKGALVLSCDVDAAGDGTYVAMLFPLWAPEDGVTERFRRPADAVQWQTDMMQRLHAAGWLLFGAMAVTTAA